MNNNENNIKYAVDAGLLNSWQVPVGFYDERTDELPSMVKLYEDNTLLFLSWFELTTNNNSTNYETYHRIGKPADITFYENGKVKSLYWWQHGALHRTDGPAFIFYREDGTVDMVEWYINHVEIKNPPDHYPLSMEEQVEMKLKYG